MSGMPPYPQPPYGPPPSAFPQPAPRATSGLAIASIVCGIASYVVCVGAPWFAPLGLIRGGIALKQRDGAVVRRAITSGQPAPPFLQYGYDDRRP